MISEKTWNGLLTIYNSDEYAPLFFQDLAEMRSPKPRIDIVRRVRAVNRGNNLSLSLAVGVALYRRIAALGLAEDHTTVSRGTNPTIEWTEGSMRVFDVAKRVIEMSLKGKPRATKSSGSSETYLFMTRAGEPVQLSKEDLFNLRVFINKLL
jgi:hypothetical protein